MERISPTHNSSGKPHPGTQLVPVRLAERSYDIVVCYGGLHAFGTQLRRLNLGDQLLVFTSPIIGRLYYERLAAALRAAGFNRIVRHDIPDGEENKNIREYERCLDAILEHFEGVGTVPTVVNFGGGVVGDLGGFVAASYRRGIPYVQVPTTLLGCVDCGVGGKVAYNHGGIKNLIGAIWQPRLVFADLQLLETLDPRQIRSGIAEVIKYGAVCSAELFVFLESNMGRLMGLEPDALMHVATKCYQIKVSVVEEDEQDVLAKRIVLNFGHTVGHAIETAAGYRLTHGEAIAIGMIAATKIGLRLGTCQPEVYERLSKLLLAAGLPTSARSLGLDLGDVLGKMNRDKKFVSGKNRFVLPTAIGSWCKREGIDTALVRDVVAETLTG